MADMKIIDLPSASAVGTSVVPVMNAAGTATNRVTLAAIAALGGGPVTLHSSSHATGGSDAITAADIGAAAVSHSHGSVTSDGKVGSTSGLPLITGASGVITAGAFGTSSGTVCQGNDSRLSNARTPTTHAASHATGGSDAITAASIGAAASSHAHGNITSAGAIGSAANLPVITGSSGVLQAGAFGTSAGTFCEGNDSRFSGKVASDTTGIAGAIAISNIVKLTQAQYDAITPNATTLYVIVG